MSHEECGALSLRMKRLMTWIRYHSLTFLEGSFLFICRISFISYEKIEELFHLKDRRMHS